MSFVMKYCPTSTVVRNPASVQNLITRSGCDNFSIRPGIFAIDHLLVQDHRSKVCVFITLGTNNGLDSPATTSRPVLSWQVLHSSHKSETAP